MIKLKVRPAEGLQIRHPLTMAILPKDGMIVEQDSYWVRRLKDGDVVLVETIENEEQKQADDDAAKNKKK